jgi:hypothetical protein
LSPAGIICRLNYKFHLQTLIITLIAKGASMPDAPVSQQDSAPATHENGRLRAVEEGRADIAAGRVLTPEHIDDWIATLGTRYEMPLPQSTLVPC